MILPTRRGTAGEFAARRAVPILSTAPRDRDVDQKVD